MRRAVALAAATLVVAAALVPLAPLRAAAAQVPLAPLRAGASSSPAADSTKAAEAGRQVVVTLSDGVSVAAAEQAIRAAGGTVTARADAIGALAVDAGSAGARAAVEARLAGDARFATVEPSYVLHAAAVPNDPMLSTEWWLDAIDVRPTWDWPAPASPVTIAIVDSGVDLTHPDLVNVLVPGRNFVQPGRDPQDDMTNGHGTHVAGIAAAQANNGIGIAGVATQARILPVKILDSSGNADDVTAAAGITWAADQGVRVINLSMEGAPRDPCPSALVQAIDYARSKDVVVVAASGNDGSAVACPARIPGVLGVGAVDRSGAVWGKSNRGPQLALTAPGVAVTSTIPVGMGSYGALTGTSMAAPVVSGVAAIVAGAAPGLDEAGIRAALTSTARHPGSPGRDDAYGAGIVDAGAALAAAAEPVRDVAAAPSVIAADGTGGPEAATLTFRVSVPVTAAVTVERPDGAVVRTLAPSPLAVGDRSLPWDGRDDAGARLPDGDYRFAIRGTAPGGVSVAITRPVALSASLVSARATPAAISPNGDGRYDRTTVTYALRAPATVAVTVRDASGRTVASLAGGARDAGTTTVDWDGRTGSGTAARVVADGAYTIDVAATTATGTWTIHVPVAVSLLGVAVTGLGATPVFPVVDGYRDLSSISYSQSGTASSTVYVYRPGSTKVFRTLPQGRHPKGAMTASWDGRDALGRMVSAGTYRIRVRTVDAAGIARWSGYANVAVSGKRLVAAVFSATLRGDQRSPVSFASLPSAAAIEPAPSAPGGIRLRSDDANEFAVGIWSFAHPSWTRVTSVAMYVDCVRDAIGDTEMGRWTGFDVDNPATIEGTGGLMRYSLPTSGIPTGNRDLVVAVRQDGPGTADVASVRVEVRYQVLR